MLLENKDDKATPKGIELSFLYLIKVILLFLCAMFFWLGHGGDAVAAAITVLEAIKTLDPDSGRLEAEFHSGPHAALAWRHGNAGGRLVHGHWVGPAVKGERRRG